MKTNSGWFDLSLIIFIMIGVNIVSSNEAKAEDLTVGSNCTYATISAALTAANPGDRLLIEGNVTFLENITITKNLTLQGGYNGCISGSSELTTLNGGGSGKVVIIEPGLTVTLVNLNLTNGNGLGGGVSAGTNSQVTLDNVRITGNTGTYGAGLYVSPAAEVTLTNGTKINNNTATIAGGGARVWGILTSLDTLSDINDNSAPHGGGVSVQEGGELHLIEADMSGNQATAADGKGGAILLENGAVSTMTGNVWIYNGNKAYDGAGIYSYDSDVFLGRATIAENTALNGGGGVYLTNDSSLSASNATVGFGSGATSGNEAAIGAGIYSSGSTVDFGGSIMDNIATQQGGGIYAQASTLTLTNAIVGGTDTNQANQLGPNGHLGAGLYFDSATQATLNNTVVSGNTFQTTQYTYGGGAYVTDGSGLTLINSSIENHLASSVYDGRGAGLYLNSSILTVDNSQIVSNTAGTAGGGIRLWGTSTLNVLNDSVIAYNHALGGAGGAIAAGSTSTINISNATLHDNIAETDGGAIYLDTGTLTVANTHLHRNSAARGGAIFCIGTVSHVSNSLIYSNTETDSGTDSGAGIYTSGGPFILQHLTIANNVGGSGFFGLASEVYNTIAWGNGGYPGFAAAPTTAMCNIDDGGNAGLIADPRFVDPANSDFHLRSDSPAIDTCTTGLSPDLNNIPRPFGDGYDMGAYEFYPKVLPGVMLLLLGED